MKNLKIITIILSLTIAAFILGGIFTASVSAVSSLTQRLAGRILLQVESKGEAWYVDPLNLTRYYLGKPKDCLDLMRKKGLGITNKDLQLIPKEENKWQVYDNYKYEFRLLIPNTWKDYQAVESDKGVDFKLPLSNDLVKRGYGTHGSEFYIGIYSKTEWAKIQQEEGPKPTFLAEKDNIIFSYSIGNGTWDLRDMTDEQAKSDVKEIIKNFSFIIGYPAQLYSFCGDGICQNVACLAIGCPTPETKDSCSQDCQ